jgi:hypothetical protein
MADRVPTLADVCCAIAEGRIAATIDGAMYKLSASELRRYLNRFRSLPTISYTSDQNCSHPDTDSWSVSARPSIA